MVNLIGYSKLRAFSAKGVFCFFVCFGFDNVEISPELVPSCLASAASSFQSHVE